MAKRIEFWAKKKVNEPIKVKFKDKDGKDKYAWITCYGPAISRIFASVIIVHGDDKGLRFPWTIAPLQTVIVPVKEDAKITVQILNLAGQVIDAKDFGTYYAGENTLELSCNSLKPGAYILNVKAGAQQGSARVVKK